MSTNVKDKSSLFETLVRKELNNESAVLLSKVEHYTKENMLVITDVSGYNQIVIPRNSAFTVTLEEQKRVKVNGQPVAVGLKFNAFDYNVVNRVRNFITTILKYGE